MKVLQHLFSANPERKSYLRNSEKNTHVKMFIAALFFLIIKTVNNLKCPSLRKRIDKRRYCLNMEYKNSNKSNTLFIYLFISISLYLRNTIVNGKCIKFKSLTQHMHIWKTRKIRMHGYNCICGEIVSTGWKDTYQVL